MAGFQSEAEPANPHGSAQPIPETAATALPAFAADAGGNAVMARRLAESRNSLHEAAMIGVVAPHAGNASVARYIARADVLARKPPSSPPVADPEVTIGPAIWSWNLHARNRPVEAAHIARDSTRPGGGIAYKDDTMRLSVRVKGLDATNQAQFEPLLISIGATDVDGLFPTFTGDGYEWNLRFSQMGRTKLAGTVSGPDVHEEWDLDLTIYGDLTDYKAALSRTSDLINADVLSAGAVVNDAAKGLFATSCGWW